MAVVATGLVVIAGATHPTGARSQGSREKQVVVTVMNLRTGLPVPGVTAAVLGVKEDGADREILKVEPATSPMSVVLLADTTHAFTRYVKELRGAAQAFVATFFAKNPGAAASLWTFGGAGIPVTQFETTPDKFMEESGKLRPRDVIENRAAKEKQTSEAESNLLDGVYDAAKALGKRAETRRIIVSFNSSTPLEQSKVNPQQIQTELQNAGASWFAVTFADGGVSSPLRDAALTQVLQYSGGLRLTIQEVARLEPAIKALVDTISTQYIVTYARASGSPKEVQIEAKGEGLRAFYARWAPK